MWFRVVPRLCVGGTGASSSYNTRLLQRRFASSSSSSSSHRGGGGSNNFRAGVVDSTPFQVKPNYSIPMWQPPARFMKYRAIRWLSNNLLALATYQLALEAAFTIAFGSLLYAEQITAQGVVDGLTRMHYPFMSWIDLNDCVYTDPVKVGPFTLNPHKMTALHTGHNIANGLLPVQVVLMLSTFSPVYRVYCRVRGLPVVAATAASAGATSSATTSAGGAAATAGAGKEGAARAAPARRASYARSSGKHSTPPRQPF